MKQRRIMGVVVFENVSDVIQAAVFSDGVMQVQRSLSLSDSISEVKATGEQMKHTVSLSKLVDLSCSLSLVGNMGVIYSRAAPYLTRVKTFYTFECGNVTYRIFNLIFYTSSVPLLFVLTSFLLFVFYISLLKPLSIPTENH